jgi:hypothetical protein
MSCLPGPNHARSYFSADLKDHDNPPILLRELRAFVVNFTYVR